VIAEWSASRKPPPPPSNYLYCHPPLLPRKPQYLPPLPPGITPERLSFGIVCTRCPRAAFGLGIIVFLFVIVFSWMAKASSVFPQSSRLLLGNGPSFIPAYLRKKSWCRLSLSCGADYSEPFLLFLLVVSAFYCIPFVHAGRSPFRNVEFRAVSTIASRSFFPFLDLFFLLGALPSYALIGVFSFWGNVAALVPSNIFRYGGYSLFSLPSLLVLSRQPQKNPGEHELETLPHGAPTSILRVTLGSLPPQKPTPGSKSTMSLAEIPFSTSSPF